MIINAKKKPVVIQAVQYFYNDECIKELINFIDNQKVMFYYDDFDSPKLEIKTLEDTDKSIHYASVGDYIIKGINGEFYPCKPDVFEKTYDIL